MNKATLGLIIALLGMVLIVVPFFLAPTSDISPLAWSALIFTGLAITWVGARELDTK